MSGDFERSSAAPSEKRGGLLILNADDWGRDLPNTDAALRCFDAGALSSVSAMVFMADSDRAAAIARDRGIETALHLNLTLGFSDPNCPRPLVETQQRIARHLRRHRLAPSVLHPGLLGAFREVVEAQMHEYQRLYGHPPTRIDGHHHMHLSANVVGQRLLPGGTMVRRNFTFFPGEKSRLNMLYRRAFDSLLRRRHRLTDYFFSIQPLEPEERLRRMFAQARAFSVEVETHPVDGRELTFLTGGALLRVVGDIPIGRPSALIATRQKS